jgi:hypothetical protein
MLIVSSIWHESASPSQVSAPPAHSPMRLDAETPLPLITTHADQDD